MSKRAKQLPADPNPSTKVNHQRVVGLLLQAARNVLAADDLASLGVALAETMIGGIAVAEAHGLALQPIVEAYCKGRKDRAMDQIAQQCKDHLQAYERFPYARAGSGEIASIVTRYAMRHIDGFDVDDLLRVPRLKKIYGEERAGRKKLVAILHQMHKENVLVRLSQGEIGALGKPAVYRLNYE